MDIVFYEDKLKVLKRMFLRRIIKSAITVYLRMHKIAYRCLFALCISNLT